MPWDSTVSIFVFPVVKGACNNFLGNKKAGDGLSALHASHDNSRDGEGDDDLEGRNVMGDDDLEDGGSIAPPAFFIHVVNISHVTKRLLNNRVALDNAT